MSTLQAEQILDIVKSTLPDLGEGKVTDLRSTRQHTHFLRRMMKEGKVDFQSGRSISFNLSTGTNQSARGVGMYFKAEVNPSNTLTSGEMPWRHFTYNWALDDFELVVNRTPREIVNLLRERKAAGIADCAIYCETRGWAYATTTNNEDFQGIPYWIVKSSTAVSDVGTTNEGFNGTSQSGYTTVGGVAISDANISPKFNNYTDVYSVLSDDDFVYRLERASDRTDFMPLIDKENHPDYDTGDGYSYCTTEKIRRNLKNLLKQANDNLGFDLDPVGNRLAFRNAPVEWVKELDADTDEPFYGINWGVFSIAGMKNRWFKDIRIERHPNQPTTTAVHGITSLNTICYDRRKNFVLAKSASYDLGS